MKIDIVQSEMKKAGDPGEQQSMNDVGADHHFWLKTIEEQEQHHDDAARAH